MLAIPFAQKTLVIAAHPDDEILGCGGTLARLRNAGSDVHILLLGEGPTAREHTTLSSNDAKEIATRSAFAAAKALSISNVLFGSFPDNRFDSLPLLDIIQHIEKVIEKTQPDLVFTHHAGDMNIDHTITHRATLTACRPLPNTKPITVLGFEVLSSTEYTPPYSSIPFEPNVFIDINNFLQIKHEALRAYASEMRPWPHPRSFEAVEHLARLRGSQCGREAAEAFILYRGIL